MIYVTNLDMGATWGFGAKTAYEAMLGKTTDGELWIDFIIANNIKTTV